MTRTTREIILDMKILTAVFFEVPHRLLKPDFKKLGRCVKHI